MSGRKSLTALEWMEVKILVGKLIEKKRYEDARKLLHETHMLHETNSPIGNQAIGALFILDMLHPEKR